MIFEIIMAIVHTIAMKVLKREKKQNEIQNKVIKP
jgi:hypothetical protein